MSFPTRRHCVHLLGSGKSKVSTSHVVAVTGVGTLLFSKPQSFLPVEEARLQPTDIFGSLNNFLLLSCHLFAPVFPQKKELFPLGCHSFILMVSAELYWPGVLSPAEAERVSRVASCTEVFYSQWFGQRQKWTPTACNERISPLGIKGIGDEMPLGFRHPDFSNIWKAQAEISSLKNRWTGRKEEAFGKGCILTDQRTV